jgi:hypothetical protein
MIKHLATCTKMAKARRRIMRLRCLVPIGRAHSGFGDRLEATPRVGDRALHAAIGRRKDEIMALLRERDSACATDAVLFAQALVFASAAGRSSVAETPGRATAVQQRG